MGPTLLAVTGLTPAIVTETVWALAKEKPRTLPRRVIFITTQIGAGKIKERLFSPQPVMGGQTVWEALRSAVKSGDEELIAEEPRIIGQANPKSGLFDPLPDIRTPAENALAASFILEEVRRVTMNPDTPLIASIAGGRKTMGALLHAAVTLLGRETDRLTHVLVGAPYENLPGFYFPGQPGPALEDREGKAHAPAMADVQLADVPYVPLRNRFDDLKEIPGSFDGLVKKWSKVLKSDAAKPAHIEISHREKRLWIDGTPIGIRSKVLAILHFLLQSHENGTCPIDQPQIAEEMVVWLKTAHFIPTGLKPAGMDTETVRHELGELRSRLKKADVGWQFPVRSLVLPPFTFRLRS
ncbi:MAG: TIGR02584 family CRISPR-associated protein [Verrucomicrobiales bacterium]|nr:TIGR02584 family CRISPR-associated protein [Verrucomicrobiales bacterium]